MRVLRDFYIQFSQSCFRSQKSLLIKKNKLNLYFLRPKNSVSCQKIYFESYFILKCIKREYIIIPSVALYKFWCIHYMKFFCPCSGDHIYVPTNICVGSTYIIWSNEKNPRYIVQCNIYKTVEYN